ncbi:hypothetical protein Ndes2526B_g07034 [Nannochloris sp. 'desiccata']|nr:hypothetical protein KSW81_004896 [Chlorella desiccata (nom. nud.)]KAH7618124.1 putative RNA methyltransferase [Chlorella desiccata (nom. nud.)]
MHSPKKLKEEDPTSHLHALQGAADQLNKNQKKKLRQKRSRLFKTTAATAAPSSVNYPTKQQQQPEHQQEKRVKSNPNTTTVPEAVRSAEPHQQRPQFSLTSSAGPQHSLARVFQQQQTGQIDDKEGIIETMPEPIYRTDMTHAARFLGPSKYCPGNDGAAAAAPNATTGNLLPAQTLPLIEDSSPAGSIHIGGGSSIHFRHNNLPTESAASAEDTPQHLQNKNHDSNVNGSATVVTAIGGSLSIFQTAPVPAPSLDLVAPTGPNGTRVYLHGNYHRYYGYRLGQEFSEDPRLALLERPWFSSKRCMDVGCNEGLVTLGIAMKFGSRSMIGVDIDEHLIKRACIHLREERSRAVVRAAEARQGGVSAAARRAARTAVSALAQTWFVHGDFLEARAEVGNIDCLTALSVTKWVHLHRGDQGLRAFFARVHSLLAPGGVFILEPQPWKSYRAAADKIRRQGGAELCLSSESFFRRVSELELRPDQFPEVLENEFGFKLLRRLQPPEVTAEGFDRPMFLFRKI